MGFVVTRRPPEVRQEEILERACGVIMERGFGNTRVADVAAALGVSSGLVFYHYDTKERLLTEAFRFAAQRDLERLQRLVHGRGSASARLGKLFRLYAPGTEPRAWMLWIDAWSQALRMPELQRVSRDLDVQWKDGVAAILRGGVDTGEFTCPDPSAAAWRLTAVLDGLAVQVTVHKGVLSRRQMLAWVRAAAACELGVDPSVFA